MKSNKTQIMLLSQRSFLGLITLNASIKKVERKLELATPEKYEDFLRTLVNLENDVKRYVDNYRNEIKEMK